jgi:redox-sensitive bicupin YhaK (pirin superfamily)
MSQAHTEQMSGPLAKADAPSTPELAVAEAPTIQVTPSREATVGSVTVRRALPRRERRTVGPWCFVDQMGPAPFSPQHPIEIGPHPHLGLHTVTWLLSGELLHRDSLGSEQVIKPGQLNLMTAGNGVAHSEQTTDQYEGSMHGVQLWVAQPERTRFGDPAFEHHEELPQAALHSGTATVLVGEFAGAASTARADTPMVGVELALRNGTSTLQLRTDFEYAAVVMEGSMLVGDERISPGALAYFGEGRDELEVAAVEPARVLFIGGEPFPEKVLMWWNFVARSREEVDAARSAWEERDQRFGQSGWTLPRVSAPEVPWAGRG